MLRYLFAIVLAVFLASPSGAETHALTQKMNQDTLINMCSPPKVISTEITTATCTNPNCDGKGGDCSVTCNMLDECQGTTPDAKPSLAGFADLTLSTALAPPEHFGLAHVGKRQLMSACGSVPGGIFGSSKSGDRYFCGNSHCDPGIGPCYVECDLSKCTAGMPKKPTGGLTLVAILQGGKGVLHGGQLDEGSTTKSGPAPGAPKAPPPLIIP